MSRLPAVTELAGGKSQRQRVWEAIRAYDTVSPHGAFNAEDVSRWSKVELPIVREYLVGLDAAGYLSAASESNGGTRHGVKKGRFLAKDNGVEAPRVRRDGSPVTQGRGTQAMWDAITALDTFTHALLAEIAQVKPATAAAYCGFLGRAGYLDLVKLGHGTGRGGIASVWRCAWVHRPKPRAPMVTRLKAVYDPNVHAIVWQAGADAAADQIDLGEVVE
jgi:hypothetical protein